MTASINGSMALSSNEHPIPSTNEDKLSSQYQTPPPEPIISFAGLKDRVRQHYELASDYYYNLWLVLV